ncbi:MAG: hypothetical protein K2Z80_10875 [Xanthobacteraceae bacterium]|nr:hypothetical protein [Xanthobacteraceae bacterium]
MRLTLATAFAVLATVAVAQNAPRAPKPYMAVAITPAKAFADPGFAAFRKAIGAAAKTRLYGDLEALVQAQGFFWDRDFGRGYDPRRPSADNLAAAIGLERRDGAGWNMLAVLATEDAVEPLDSRPGVVCAPARPGYDSIEFSKLLDKTYTGEVDWAYPRAGETPVLAAPQAGAPAVGTLGLQFVRLLGFEGPESDVPGRNQWAHVALPDGKTGYAAPGSLMSLTPDRLCYIKDLVVGWRIAGFVAGGN